MPRTEMTRLPEKGSTELAALHALLDDAFLAHIGLVADDHPLVIPTAVVRDGDRLVIHGSTGSRWMRALADGAKACVSVTALDAVVVARSAFESSFQYRSAVLFGRFSPVTVEETSRLLDLLVDRLIPGRSAEVRQSTARELAATLLLSMPIQEWSLRVSAEWPEDEPTDVAGAAWAGVVPVRRTYGEPLARPTYARESRCLPRWLVWIVAAHDEPATTKNTSAFYALVGISIAVVLGDPCLLCIAYQDGNHTHVPDATKRGCSSGHVRFDVTTRASPEQVREGLTDFTERRLQIWSSTLDPKTYEVRALGDSGSSADTTGLTPE